MLLRFRGSDRINNVQFVKEMSHPDARTRYQTPRDSDPQTDKKEREKRKSLMTQTTTHALCSQPTKSSTHPLPQNSSYCIRVQPICIYSCRSVSPP